MLKGEAGVQRSIAAVEARGETVIGREITFDTAAARTRADIVARDASGNLKIIESKNGEFATHQEPKDGVPTAREREGGIPWGESLPRSA